MLRSCPSSERSILVQCVDDPVCPSGRSKTERWSDRLDLTAALRAATSTRPVHLQTPAMHKNTFVLIRKFLLLGGFAHKPYSVCSDLNVVLFLGHDAILPADLLLNAAVQTVVPFPRLLIHAVMEALQEFKFGAFDLNANKWKFYCHSRLCFLQPDDKIMLV